MLLRGLYYQSGWYIQVDYNFQEQEMPVDTFDRKRRTFIPKGTTIQASTLKSRTRCNETGQQQFYPGHPFNRILSRPVDPQLRMGCNNRKLGIQTRQLNTEYNDYTRNWPRPGQCLTTGGLAGGLFDMYRSSETGDAYEGKYSLYSTEQYGILPHRRIGNTPKTLP